MLFGWHLCSEVLKFSSYKDKRSGVCVEERTQKFLLQIAGRQTSEPKAKKNVFNDFEYFLENRLHPLLANLVVLLLGVGIALLMWKVISLLLGQAWLQ